MTQSLHIPTAPRWFWIAAGAALLWNAAGVFAFVSDATLSAEDIANLPEATRALYESHPFWATAAYGLAVFGGLIGSVLLFLRSRWSTTAFAASLLGIIVQDVYWFFVADVMTVVGPSALFFPALVLALGLLLLWWSRSVARVGWLR